MAKRATLQKIVLLILLVTLIYSCANQIPPSGGDVDRVPPDIIEVFPPDQTVNYAETYIELTFSEYVNKRSVQEAIFISPNISGHIEYNWSGKTLEIDLPDSLLENTTYTITIGTDVEDINNKNKMERAYSFAFSTGSVIDRGKVVGTVLDKNASGVMIYAYKVISDTLNPTKQKPNYITQCGIDGTYSLTGLADGTYRVFAVKDDFMDLLFDADQDKYGSPYTEINLSKSDSLFSNLNFQLTSDDTTKPRVYGLTMTDQHHILIEFSEGIDSTKLTGDNFFIYDSANSRRTDINYFFKGKTKKKNFLISFKDTLMDSEQLFIATNNLFDNSGNELSFELTSFVRNENPDTTQPEMIKFTEQFPNKKVDYRNGYVNFVYSDGFSFDSLKKSLKVVDKKNNKIEYNILKNDDASFIFQFNDLKPNSDFEIKIDQNLLVDAAGNKIDSIFTYKFTTINNLDFSGISGNVDAPENLNIVVSASNISDSKLQYSQNKKVFNFERVFPGKYLLIAFDDVNNNGKLDKGSIYPFQKSERFLFYPDTLELKPRWPVGDITINFE